MKRPLRVCVVAACPVPFPRGTPVRVTRLSEALAGMGHTVHVVTYGAGVGSIDPRIRVHRTASMGGLDVEKPGPSLGKLLLLDPLLAMLLRRVTREESFDVIHAHHYEGLLVARCVAPKGVPIVYDAHTILETELPYYAPRIPAGLKRLVGRTFDDVLPRQAGFVIAVSEVLRDHLIATGSVTADQIAAVGNGVELDGHLRPGPATEPVGGEGVITYAGNLAEYQGIEHLLRAFHTVVERRPGASLRILTRSSFDRFEPLARKLGIRRRIEIASVPLESLRTELARSHVTVNPRPRCDGVPQKNLNYMAAGTAVVAFQGSLHPCRDQESGVAVAPVNGQALGEAILDLLDRPDERLRLGRAARAAVMKDYTWQRQGERVTEVYEQLLGL